MQELENFIVDNRQINSPGINIKDLNVSFEHQDIFKNLQLDIRANRWTCFLGPSGIGKTTLLRLIAELMALGDIESSPTGKISASDNLPLHGRISYMAQQDLLMPWLSVLKNVLIGYNLRSEKISPEIKSHALELLEKVGLKNVVNLRPEKLSMGMRQRVALVRTLVENRPIVLMDEPFSALDVITRLKLQEISAELLTDKTVCLITHDPLEALRLADDIYVMTGSPVKIQKPIHPKGTKPRDISNPDILQKQAELLKLLEGDKR